MAAAVKRKGEIFGNLWFFVYFYVIITARTLILMEKPFFAERQKEENMQKYRNEWKYLCTEAQLRELEMRLRGVLSPDIHADADGGYGIHSLYFDDIRDSCLNDTEAGNGERFKYRIRFYGKDPSTLHLERKEKLYGRCRKLSCPLSLEQYERIMRGEIREALRYAEAPLEQRFLSDILSYGFQPKAIVDYDRVVYLEPIANIRITFDRFITAGNGFENFLSGDYLRIPIREGHNRVLEVKFDAILPGYLKELIRSPELQQTTFSKYYYARTTLAGR